MESTYCLTKGTFLHGKNYDYKIVKTLSQGSFGITYLAAVRMRGGFVSLDATVYVAIKEFFMHEINGREGSTVTSGSKAGVFDKYKDKFIKEAINLSKIKHDNIIRVVDEFEANNTAYYAMEFVEGESLDDLIKNHNGLTEDEALKYALQIGEALKFMHSKNMLHLDLKPSNVMLHDGKAILIDFALSKQFDEYGNPESSISIGGGAVGYAPLEQTNYKGEKKDGLPVTMDIYAFGATLFEMLTGHKPPVASDILNNGFPANDLSVKGFSQKLIDIIKKTMEPLSKNRFQSFDEILKELYALCRIRNSETTSYDEGSEDTSFDNKYSSSYPNYRHPDPVPMPVVYGGPIPSRFDNKYSSSYSNYTHLDPEPAPVYGGPIPSKFDDKYSSSDPNYRCPDLEPETVYAGPIPSGFDEPEPNPAKSIMKTSVCTVLVIGLIVLMTVAWSDKLSYGSGVFYNWFIDCVIITITAGIGIIRPNLFRKYKGLWFGLFVPSLLNPLIWDPNWYWKWVAEIVIFTPMFIFSSKMNDKILRMIMILFIIFASLMIFIF